MDTDKNVHTITLDNRNILRVLGVKEIVSFDEFSVILNTEKGRLCINGSGLHIQELSVDTGVVCVDGQINELIYVDAVEPKKGGIFGRLLR
ncbi:MAG: sporulation protein YabP [Clostridia bacterium]|nr:sporulation protein YabP [Clostridia bacterium]